MNKRELIKKIKEIQDITGDEKAYLIDLINTKKKYGLVWEDKPEDVEEQLRSMLPIFKEVKDRAIISEDKNAPNHILIEGDNLLALTALSYTHEGKIDVIYIDPPYNTGNKDFIYNDHYVDKEDTYRHSKWLSFMEKRLNIAKQLLSKTGVIFISIDDNELAQLKMLSDEIYNENNLVGLFTWVRKKKGSNLSKEFRKITENLLCYKNGTGNIELFGLKAYSEKQVPLLNRPNNISIINLPANKIMVGKDVKNSEFKKGTYGSGELIVELLDDIVIENNFITTPFSIRGRFRWSQTTIDSEVVNGSEFYISKTFRINVLRYNQDEKFKSPSSLITPEDGIGTNEDGSEELRNIFCDYEKLPFDYPKPTSLLKYIINSVTAKNKNGTIFDFFAGSGTTLHSTMALNDEDGGNRQCIMVTNNENNIAEKVTYERNKRVIQGYTNSKGEVIKGLSNNNLRYFQSDFIPSERSEINRRLLTARSTELLSIKEDCFLCVTIDYNINPKQAQIFTNGLGKYMMVVYYSRNQEAIIEKLIEVINELETTEKIKVYSFSPEKDHIEDDFFAVAEKIEAVALPDSIYNAYRATFRTLKLNKKPASAKSQTPEN